MLGESLIKNIAVVLIIVCFILTACNSINTFESTIESINEDKFVVNCSDEVNRGKNNVNSIGYLCDVYINNKTKFMDSEGNAMQFDEFSQTDLIQIILLNPQDISERNRHLDATKIILLDRQ